MGWPHARSLLSRIAELTVLVVLGMTASSVGATDIEPRAYSNIPVGMNFLLAGYGYTKGNVTFAPSVPIENGEMEIHSTVLAYVGALDFWGKSGKVDIIIPQAWMSGQAEFMGEPRSREISGFGDPLFRLYVNLFGAPALSMNEFANYYSGGRITRDGKIADNLQQNWRVGATLSFPINKQNSIKISGNTVVHSRTDSFFDTIGITWQYRWGKGL
jgi:hypothetical protein